MIMIMHDDDDDDDNKITEAHASISLLPAMALIFM